MNTDEKFKIIDLPTMTDERGALTVFEEGRQIPFTMKRGFFIQGVPHGLKRGGHAHKDSWQVHIAIGGTATILLDTGTHQEKIVLDSSSKALYVAPLVWGEFELSAPDTVLLVMSSDIYNQKDYIRDHDEFLAAVKA